MVSVYAKAAVITLVLFASNFALVKYLDDSRADQLRTEMASIAEDVQSANTLILYSQVFNGSAEQCPLLRQQAGLQQNRLYSLYADLDRASTENVLADTSAIKRSFVISNVQLWLYLQQLDRSCGGSGVSPVIYFYNGQGECDECRAQAQVLDGVVRECPNVRVFALPFESQMQTVSAIVERYKVTGRPSLVINDKVFSGIQSAATIINQTGCILNETAG
jgi:hypothetical protein